MTWTVCKRAIVDTDAENDTYARFADRGAETLTRFKSADLATKVEMLIHATVYSFGTYQTDESQVAAAWDSTIGHFEGAELDDYEAFLRQTKNPGKKIEWLQTSIENGVFTEAVEIYGERGLKAACDHLINYRHSDAETGAKGFMSPKVGMAFLLLGEPDAFVVDRNVAAVIAKYLQKRYQAGENLDNLEIEVPKCTACWNTFNDGRCDKENHDEYFAKVKNYGSTFDIHPWKRSHTAYFHNLEFFEDYHLKGEHIKNYGEILDYGKVVNSKVSDLLDADLSNRMVTQILFNLGMETDGGKTEASASETYTHEGFYQTV